MLYFWYLTRDISAISGEKMPFLDKKKKKNSEKWYQRGGHFRNVST